jgi:tetrahydromethanopterin S-methyltransferase subunit G
VLVMTPTAFGIAAGVMFEKGDVIGMVVAQVAQSVGSLMGLCMGVALYGIIIGMPEPAAAAE